MTSSPTSPLPKLSNSSNEKILNVGFGGTTTTTISTTNPNNAATSSATASPMGGSGFVSPQMSRWASMDISMESFPSGIFDGSTEGDSGNDVLDSSTKIEQYWENKWKQFGAFIRPYEADRTQYKIKPYPRPLYIEVHRKLWKVLIQKRGLRRALDGFVVLGFVPADPKEAKETTSFVANASPSNTPVAASPMSGTSAPTSGGPTHSSVYFRLLDTSKNTVVAAQKKTGIFHSHASVVSDEGGAEFNSDRVKELESEVRDLTKQLRLLKCRDGAVQEATISPMLPPVPVIVTHGKPIVAPISGGSPICLQVNYLDPDLAPFVVSIAGYGGQQLLPCSVVSHRFIVFVAPAQATPGSISCTILCSPSNGGGLKRYTKAVWIEYRDLDGMNALSHHSVNQLLSDVPLPSSTTAPDPSEPEQPEGRTDEGGKSEYDAYDATEDGDDQHTMISEQNFTSMNDDHPPLTREMLDMLQVGGPRVAFAGISSVHEREGSSYAGGQKLLARSQDLPSNSGVPSECSETPASSLAITSITHVTHGSNVQDGISISQASMNSEDGSPGSEREKKI